MHSSFEKPEPPPCLPSFEGIKRYWDKTHQMFSARILPGEYYVTTSDEVIATVLGSCVSACICDRRVGIGGMNHFMLPDGKPCSLKGKDSINKATRYGTYAMEHMINDILKNGGSRKNLEIKLFGGGRVLSSMTNIGAINIDFVHEYLTLEKLPVMSEDLGGTYARKVLYFPKSGKVLMKKLPIDKSDEVVNRELEYKKTLEQEPVSGEVDLF